MRENVERWNERWLEAQRFFSEYGRWPRQDERIGDGRYVRLGQWVSGQRQMLKKDDPSPEVIRRGRLLHAHTGWCWTLDRYEIDLPEWITDSPPEQEHS